MQSSKKKRAPSKKGFNFIGSARKNSKGNCLVVNPKVVVNEKIIILFFSLLSLATLSQLLAWETRSVLITTTYFSANLDWKLVCRYRSWSSFLLHQARTCCLWYHPCRRNLLVDRIHRSSGGWLRTSQGGDRGCADQGTVAAIQNDAAGGMVISDTHRTGCRMGRGQMLVIELNNGRTAHMGILALMVHEKLNNNPLPC